MDSPSATYLSRRGCGRRNTGRIPRSEENRFRAAPGTTIARTPCITASTGTGRLLPAAGSSGEKKPISVAEANRTSDACSSEAVRSVLQIVSPLRPEPANTGRACGVVWRAPATPRGETPPEPVLREVRGRAQACPDSLRKITGDSRKARSTVWTSEAFTRECSKSRH